jgi:beta-barrel assembly-enhancing protease
MSWSGSCLLLVRMRNAMKNALINLTSNFVNFFGPARPCGVVKMRTVAALVSLASVTFISGCAVSTQQEVEMGQQEAQQISTQLPMLQDAEINNYVNDLGNRIAKLTPRSDLEWHFAVVNTSVVNAFALPGGYVYVNRGILEHASSMDELAGVMGHEIEHVVLRHSVKQMEQQQGANIGLSIACALTNVCESQVTQAVVNVGATAVFAKFSREDEVQADDGGFQNVMRAGISPRGMLTFFQKLLAEEQSQGGSGSVAPWFSDHPGTEDRIADIQRMLDALPPGTLAKLQTNTSAFVAMKQRLAQLPPAPAPRAAQTQ